MFKCKSVYKLISLLFLGFKSSILLTLFYLVRGTKKASLGYLWM